jgi:hypothetical protein
MLEKLIKKMKNSPPKFNLLLEGTFRDEMAYSYLQLCSLNVPQNVGVIEEPKRAVIAPKVMELTEDISVDKYEDCRYYKLFARTKDFQSMSLVKEGQFRKLLNCNLCSSPDFQYKNVYIPLSIETCFFACTRDGRIFVNTDYVENKLTETPSTILPVLVRMKTIFDSKFSHTGKRRHYNWLVENLKTI